MSTLHESLAKISEELNGLLTVVEKPTPSPSSITMSPEQFLAYAWDQVRLAKTDEDPSPRVAALVEVVKLAKSYSWQEDNTMSVPVYTGPLSVQATSAEAEKIAEHPGKSLGAPGPQASPTSGGFEAGSGGVSGPASNVASPEARYSPPAMPASTPAAAPMGFLAKAEEILKGHPEAESLMRALQELIANEPADALSKPGETTVAKEDGWVSDLASPCFMEGTTLPEDEDFGAK